MPPRRAIVVTGIEGSERKDDLISPPLSSLYFNYYCRDFVDFSTTVSTVPKLWSEWIKARHKKFLHRTLRLLNEHLGGAHCTASIHFKHHHTQWHVKNCTLDTLDTHKAQCSLPAHAHCTTWAKKVSIKEHPKQNLSTTFSAWPSPPCHQNCTFGLKFYLSQTSPGVVNTFFQVWSTKVSWSRVFFIITIKHYWYHHPHAHRLVSGECWLWHNEA